MQKKSTQIKRIKSKSQKQKAALSRLPSTQYTSFTEYKLASTVVTNFNNSSSLLNSIQTLLASFPAHATPIYQDLNLKLRQKIWLSHIELRTQFVGAQSTVLASADLYNSIRLALYLSGPSFQESNVPYLTSVIGGGTLDDVKQIYVDKVVSLPSQAIDNVSGYNVPQVINHFQKININRYFDWYSLTPTGTANWETVANDLMIDVVSDSSVTPHPTVEWSARIFFTYVF